MATGNQIARREMARAITGAIDNPTWALVHVNEQPSGTYMTFEVEKGFVGEDCLAGDTKPTRVIRLTITAAPDLGTP